MRKKANRPGAARGRFREGGPRKTTDITLDKQPDPVPPEPQETTIEDLDSEPDPVIPESLIHELRLRSTERRDAGTEPWTLQDIVTEALRGWLSNPKNK